MRSTKYSNIPSARRQLVTAAVVLLLCVGFTYFFNPEAPLSPEMKRFMTRAGGILIMGGGVLGAYGFLWFKKNASNRQLAKINLQAYAEAVRVLTNPAENTPLITPVLEQLEADMTDAATAEARATKFEETVANVGIGALAFVVVGTILQFWAA